MERSILKIAGSDRTSFLENLISNSVARTVDGPVYAALLTPQGKYLVDFIMTAQDDAILLDVSEDAAPALAQRLTMYRLRADVQVSSSGLKVIQGQGNTPEGAFVDPRHPALGWRAYVEEGQSSMSEAEWNALRVEHVIPDTNIELIPNESYILESGFERLHGVDFRKGCYVGQEVTARMKHKTELKKGLVKVHLSEPVPVGTEITADGKSVGTVYTQANGAGIAFVRFDRTSADMTAGAARVTL
jgi:hypothetical protein